MNANERKDLELILYRLDEIEKDMKESHLKNRADLKFIKENLFDPDTGLWAETRLNTQFRSTVSKTFWFIVPASIATFFKLVWDYFKGS